MSRLTLGHKTGLIFALVTLVLGVIAGAALGWAGGEEQQGGGKTHGHGPNKKPTTTQPTNTQPTNTQPTTTQPTTKTQPAPPPGVQTTPTPAPSATPPSETPKRVSARGGGGKKGKRGEQKAPSKGGRNVLVKARVRSGGETAIAPAAERGALARTGLSPSLIALLGAFCLVGGAFLFRRGLAR
jgi:hypothetical protein